MGGDIARTMALSGDFRSNYTFGQGLIHKLVTIGTPHFGTPLATQMLQDANSCVRHILDERFSFSSVSFGAFTVAGAVGDLSGDGNGGHLSEALSALSGPSPFPIAYIAAKMSSSNLSVLDCDICHAGEIRAYCYHHGDPLAKSLTSSGWPSVFGQDSDAIVPLTSQLGGGSGITLTGVIHSYGVRQLGFRGPSELDDESDIFPTITDLLNERSDGSDFRR
jgi:hypothetical protein